MSIAIAPAPVNRAVTLSTLWDPSTAPHVQIIGANAVQRHAAIHQLLATSCQLHGELIIPAPAWMAPGAHVDEVERTLEEAIQILDARLTSPGKAVHALTVVIDERHIIAREARNPRQLQHIDDAIRRLVIDGPRATMHLIVGDIDLDTTLVDTACTIAVGPLTSNERDALDTAYPGTHAPALEDGEAWFYRAGGTPARVQI
ncbi:hypothetical protein [Microbacterium xylanilyticum]